MDKQQSHGDMPIPVTLARWLAGLTETDQHPHDTPPPPPPERRAQSAE